MRLNPPQAQNSKHSEQEWDSEHFDRKAVNKQLWVYTQSVGWVILGE